MSADFKNVKGISRFLSPHLYQVSSLHIGPYSSWSLGKPWGVYGYFWRLPATLTIQMEAGFRTKTRLECDIWLVVGVYQNGGITDWKRKGEKEKGGWERPDDKKVHSSRVGNLSPVNRWKLFTISPVKLLLKFTNKICEKTGESPVKHKWNCFTVHRFTIGAMNSFNSSYYTGGSYSCLGVVRRRHTGWGWLKDELKSYSKSLNTRNGNLCTTKLLGGKPI